MTAPGHDWLAERALRSPQRPALLSQAGEWTFADLHRRATAGAAVVREAGVSAGDRVALLAANDPFLVPIIHAVPRADAILAPLNIRFSKAELRDQVQRLQPHLIVSDAAHADLAAALAATGGARVLPLSAFDAASGVAPASSAALPAPLPVPAHAVHTILFTSGTSGRAKGAMLTHGNHFAGAVGSALNLGVVPGDRWLLCLPLFHVGGLAILIRSAVYGVPVILHDAFDAGAVNRAIDTDGVTLVSVVAVMLQRLIEERGGQPLPASFRAALLGGGPVPEPLVQACAGLGLPVAPTYGLTEAASQVATLPPAEAVHKPGSVGRPLWGTRIRIVRDGVEVEAGEDGEIEVRGPTVMAGYYRDEAATAAAFNSGWLRTGDAGRLDAAGDLFVLDRRDDLIISGGENVYPAEVESVLLAHPAVLEAAVVGLPDPEWGRHPAAAVVLRPQATVTPQDLLEHCARALARFKQPRSIRIVEALPRTAAGKVQRHRVRDDWRVD